MGRIAVDVREACRQCPTGKGRWTAGFVTELLRRKASLLLVTDTDEPDRWKGAEKLVIPGKGLQWHLRAAAALRTADIDAYISTVSYIVPSLIRHPPVFTVVHDLIAFRDETHDKRAAMIERLTLGRAVRNSRCLLTISDSTRADLRARYPSLPEEKVKAIFAGPTSEPSLQRTSDGKTILCVGTLCPRKNQLRLIKAYASLPEDVRGDAKLRLIGGRGWGDEEIIRAANSTPGVTWTGYASDSEWERLLATCHCFALPSLYEGFGLPVLDAMLRGVPTLTSARGSLAEVAGSAAIVVEPEDEASIAHGLKQLLTDGNLRERLAKEGPEQAKMFTWQRTCELFLRTLADTVKA